MKYRLLDILCCPYDRYFPLILSIDKINYNNLHQSWHKKNPHCNTYCGYHDKEVSNLHFFRYECDKCMYQEIEDGFLFCPSCNRGYPIKDKIPSIMPDELREKNIYASRNLSYANINVEMEKKVKVNDKKAEIEARNKGSKIPFQIGYVKRMEIYSLQRRISPNKEGRLLDIGAGVGETSLNYIRNFGEVVVADFAFEVLKKSLARYEREMIKKIYPVHMDACLMPFRQRVFTDVISLQMLHHIPGFVMRENVLKGIKEVTDEDGKIIITVYNNNLDNFLARMQRVQDYTSYALKEGFHGNGIYYHNFSFKELKGLVKKYFIVEEIVGCALSVPRMNKYFRQYEGLNKIAGIFLEKMMVSHIFGKLLLVVCRKKIG